MRCLFYNCTGTNPNGSGRRVPNLENRCNKMSLENHGELRETRMRHAAAIAARGLHTSEAGPVCHSEQTPSHLHGSRNSANVTRHEMSANPSPMLPSTVGISGATVKADGQRKGGDSVDGSRRQPRPKRHAHGRPGVLNGQPRVTVDAQGAEDPQQRAVAGEAESIREADGLHADRGEPTLEVWRDEYRAERARAGKGKDDRDVEGRQLRVVDPRPAHHAARRAPA
eukprot:scaffold88043_cov27-Tisochrysis_lutea.AAC.1